METVAILASPIAPFYTDKLFNDLNKVSGNNSESSVHLANFPIAKKQLIDVELEERMSIAQKVSSMVLSIRAKEKLKVRQPLQKIMVPILDASFEDRIKAVSDLILSEVNVKELELLTDTTGVLVKKIKPNFKTIGKKYGRQMKAIISLVNQFTQEDIANAEQNNGWKGEVDGVEIELDLNDFAISTDDIPGWLITTEGNLTVALDVTISKELKDEGIAREFVNRIQNLRKESGLEVIDKINLTILSNELINDAVKKNLDYICSETLANSLTIVDEITSPFEFEIEKGVNAALALTKV